MNELTANTHTSKPAHNPPADDKTTSQPSSSAPVLPIITGGGSPSPSSPPQQCPSEDGENSKQTCGDFFRRAMKTYSASLLTVGVMMPVVASFTAVGLYLTLPNSPLLPFLGISPDSQWYTLVYSSFITAVIWLLTALPYCYLSTARGANVRNYSLLRSRLHQLQASLGLPDYVDDTYEEINTITTTMKQAGYNEHNKYQWNVVKEAYACCIDITRTLSQYSAGLAWTMGPGYNSAWTLLHHAEEVMIEVADVQTVVRGANHDFLAIEGSQIDGRDELLENIIQAVQALEPGASVYFKEHQPSKSSVVLSRLTQMINKTSDPLDRCNASSKNNANPDAQTRSEAAARVILREARSTLNDYRDKRWEGLVRQRSRLLKVIAVTAIVTHALLCITILASPPQAAHQQFTSLQSGVLAAAIFYVVGAIAGLFLRFYAESRSSTSVDDFSLSTTRLIATPVLSGLAGIIGVLAAEMLASLGGLALGGSAIEKPLQLPTLFSLDARLLLTAAVFGVAPNLVIRGLQQRANEYEDELQRTKAAEASTERR